MNNDFVKEVFDKFWNRRDGIDSMFRIFFNQGEEVIDHIYEKHRIFLEYKLNKKLPKFDKDNINDYILYKNVRIYIKAMTEAIEKLIMLSESKEEIIYLKGFLFIMDETKYRR